MAQCTYCKAETQLYESGVPICFKCAAEREAKPKPPQTDREIRRILLQDVLEATSRSHEAGEEFEVVTGQVPSGLPHPDGAQRIRNASAKLSFARKSMMTAHTRLNDYLERGIMPEDLKRSG